MSEQQEPLDRLKANKVSSGEYQSQSEVVRDALLGAIRASSDEERIKTLRAAGIINNKGGLTKRYQSREKAISMTPELQPVASAKRKK